ncbi:hypothetical protein B0T14DRAFT_521863 [Immersiella caudata]|uniref:Secreted protein n=1 Tax=Immersiella caudata TaxID=314043 RepID=A0AA39WSC4_9PEZI|nr:hypothetical protein B0T14DRAFT_521863 [Immersiella caudata]
MMCFLKTVTPDAWTLPLILFLLLSSPPLHHPPMNWVRAWWKRPPYHFPCIPSGVVISQAVRKAGTRKHMHTRTHARTVHNHLGGTCRRPHGARCTRLAEATPSHRAEEWTEATCSRSS